MITTKMTLTTTTNFGFVQLANTPQLLQVWVSPKSKLKGNYCIRSFWSKMPCHQPSGIQQNALIMIPKLLS